MPLTALFVATDGSDLGLGTQSSPLRTVQAAVNRALPGQTVVVRGGTYHESVTVPATKLGLTIQAYPNEAVWFDGTSTVDGWSQSGGKWVHDGWTNQFDHSESFAYGQNNPYGWTFVGAQNPMAAWPDGLWINGSEQRQVSAASLVTTGTFFADYPNHRLVAGSQPSGDVRASDLTRAFFVAADHVTIQGIGVRRYGTPLPAMGAVVLAGASDVLRDTVVSDNATQGVSFERSDGLADHVTTDGNGMTGIHANVADGLVVRNSVISNNNAQQFNTSPSAAGIKMTRSRHTSFIDNDFVTNQANGLWFDMDDVGFTITGNTFTDNAPMALQLELADTGIVADNRFSGGRAGVFDLNSGNVQIYNNTFAAHSMGAVFLSQDARRQNNPSDYASMGDRRFPMGDPTDPWLVRNITVANNVFGWNGGQYGFQFYVLDKATNIAAGSMNLAVTGNQFHSRANGTDTMVAWGGGDNHTMTYIESPSSLDSILGHSWVNSQVPVGGVATSNPAIPLPADVAAALHVATGLVHLGIL